MRELWFPTVVGTLFLVLAIVFAARDTPWSASGAALYAGLLLGTASERNAQTRSKQ